MRDIVELYKLYIMSNYSLILTNISIFEKNTKAWYEISTKANFKHFLQWIIQGESTQRYSWQIV